MKKARLFEGIPDGVYERVFNRLQALRLKHRSYRDDELLTLLLCQADVDRVAAEDYAKKLDELKAKNATLKCRLDVLHWIFLDYSIESDTTLRDVVTRLAAAAERNALAAKELAMIRVMLKSRVPVGQSADYLDEHDACGGAVSALLSFSDALANELMKPARERIAALEGGIVAENRRVTKKIDALVAAGDELVEKIKELKDHTHPWAVSTDDELTDWWKAKNDG